MRVRRVSWKIILLLATVLAPCAPVAAQEAFVAGSTGASIGEGTSVEFSVSAGYLTSKRFGIEVEFSGRPDVEFPIPPVPVIQELRIPTVFPGFQVDRSGHVLSFHTRAVVPVFERGAVRVSARAGGGVATLFERIHIHSDAITLPTPFPGIPPVVIPEFDRTTTVSQTGLSLQALGTLDVFVNTHLSIGAQGGYQHAFISNHPLDLGRFAARVSWRF